MPAFRGPNIPDKELLLVNDPANPRLQKPNRNLMNAEAWTVSTGSIGEFFINGSAAENVRLLGPDPWGNERVLWETQPDDVSGADGGWNSSFYPVDITKTYRVSVWAKRPVTGNGNFYLGISATGIGTAPYTQGSNGANNTNPYFWVGMPSADWMLVVGHVHPTGTATPIIHPDSGRYDLTGTKFGNITTDFVFHPSQYDLRHRCYLYYSTDTATRQQMCLPRIDLCDGTEPTIAELIAGFPDTRSVNGAQPSQSSVVSGARWRPDNGGVFEYSHQHQYQFYSNVVSSVYSYPLSFGGWFYPSSTGGVMMGVCASNVSSRYIVLSRVSNSLRLTRRNTTNFVDTIQTMSANSWYCVFVVLHSSTSYSVYVNGELVFFTDTADAVNLSNQMNDVLYGILQFLDYGSSFVGQQGVSWVYNDELTADEIWQLYLNTKSRYGL